MNDEWKQNPATVAAVDQLHAEISEGSMAIAFEQLREADLLPITEDERAFIELGIQSGIAGLWVVVKRLGLKMVKDQ